MALACAAAAYAWAVWGGNPVSFWANSGSATPPHKVFTVEELSRFTGGAPLNLTKIAEVRAAAEDKQAEQAKQEAENTGEGEAVAAAGTAEGAEVAGVLGDDESEKNEGALGEGKKMEDQVLVDSSIPIYLAVLGRVFDVTKGADYYGPGAGGYSGFAGRDGSRAFGNFMRQTAN